MQRSTVKKVLLAISLLTALGLSPADPARSMSQSQLPREFRIAFYNLHNFFDTVHTIEDGKEKNDWRYLPKESCQLGDPDKCGDRNWTAEKLEMKAQQILQALSLHAKHVGDEELPDILGLCEVESPVAIEQLAKTLGYKNYLITKSRDPRGIDVVLLYRSSIDIKLKSHNYYHIEGVTKETRPILEAEFEIAGKSLYTYVNHWPSQRNPSDDRVKAAIELRRLVERRSFTRPEAFHIAMGDFNTVPNEKGTTHPFRDILLKSPDITDLHEVADSASRRKLGTYFYWRKKMWQRLDRFFVSNNLLESQKLSVDKSSYEIFSEPAINRDGRPWGYDTRVEPGKGNPGYSDHYLISLKLLAKD